MKIQPIVEGHGEVSALPVLLRRFRDEAEVWDVDIGRPIRRPRSRLVQEEELRQAVRLALLQPDCGAVLILFDGESDSPPSWDRQRPRLACRAASFWRTGNTRLGFWLRSSPYAGAAASGRTQSLIRTRSALAAPRSNWKRGCSPARATWKPRTNPRLAHCSRCRTRTAAHDRSASSQIRSRTWSAQWSTTSACGRRPPGPTLLEGASLLRVTRFLSTSVAAGTVRSAMCMAHSGTGARHESWGFAVEVLSQR